MSQIDIIKSNFVGPTRFWNNLYQARSKSKYLKANKYYKRFRSKKTKGLNRITKIGIGHMCLSEENFSAYIYYFI